MEILVIGGSGFIGTRLVEELLSANHKVRILDINQSAKYPELTAIGDVRNVNDIISASKGIDVIYNLAAEHRDDVSPINLYHEVNVEGARNVIQAAETNQVDSIIFTSTVAIYGLDKNSPDESFPAEPFNEYGRTKWEAELLFNTWASEDKDRSLIIIRPAVVFGEGNRGNVYNLISQIKTGRFVMIGNGRNRKSMGYVGNIALFLSEAATWKKNDIYNFCDKPDLTSSEIALIAARALNKKLPKLKLPLFLGLIFGTMLDAVAKITNRTFPISAVRIKKFTAETTINTEKLQSTGFMPRHTLVDGLANMIEIDFK